MYTFASMFTTRLIVKKKNYQSRSPGLPFSDYIFFKIVKEEVMANVIHK